MYWPVYERKKLKKTTYRSTIEWDHADDYSLRNFKENVMFAKPIMLSPITNLKAEESYFLISISHKSQIISLDRIK